MVLRSTGTYVLIKGGTEYPNWTLLWISPTLNNTPLFPGIGIQTNATLYVFVWVLAPTITASLETY